MGLYTRKRRILSLIAINVAVFQKTAKEIYIRCMNARVVSALHVRYRFMCKPIECG